VLASRVVSPNNRYFASFQEVLAPAVMQFLVDAFLAAQLGNGTFASQAL